MRRSTKFRLGQLWNNLSVVRRRLGDLQSSMESSRRAIGIFDKLGDRGELARFYNGLGLTQAERREFDPALGSYRRGLDLAESPHVVAAIHANLCDLYLRQQEVRLPEELARIGLDIALRCGYKLVLGNLYRALGTLSRLRLDAQGADFFERALEIVRQHRYLHVQADVHLEYGLFHQAREDTAQAIAQFEKAFALYRHLGAENDLRRAQEILCGSGRENEARPVPA